MVFAPKVSDKSPRANLHTPAATSSESLNVIILQYRERLPLRTRRIPSRVLDNVGEWLSLVEHLVRDQGVGGSNPLSPTIIFKHLNCTSGFPPTSMVSKL